MENTLQMPECETTIYKAGDSAKIVSFVIPGGCGLFVNGRQVHPSSLPVRIGKADKIEVTTLPDFSEKRKKD